MKFYQLAGISNHPALRAPLLEKEGEFLKRPVFTAGWYFSASL